MYCLGGFRRQSDADFTLQPQQSDPSFSGKNLTTDKDNKKFLYKNNTPKTFV